MYVSLKYFFMNSEVISFLRFMNYLYVLFHLRFCKYDIYVYTLTHPPPPSPEKPTNKPKKQKQKTPKNQQKKLTRENPRILDSDDS